MSRAYVISRRRLRASEFLRKQKAEIMKCIEATRHYITNPQFCGSIPPVTLDIPLVDAMGAHNSFPMLPDYPSVWARKAEHKAEGALVPLSTMKQPPGIPMEHDCEAGHASSAETLSELLGFLKEAGQHVSEVKALPSGAVRINVDELLSGMKAREHEYVYAGGRR